MKNQSVRKQRRVLGSQSSFEILSITFGILFSSCFYYLIIRDQEPGLQKYINIFFGDLIGSILGGIFAYLIYDLLGHYSYNDLNTHSPSKWLRVALTSVISAAFVYYAFVEIVQTYTADLLEIIIILGFIKISIWAISEITSQKILGS